MTEQKKLTPIEIELLIDDYSDMEVGGHAVVSYDEGIRWVDVNAELSSRGLVAMSDYVLQKVDAPYEGLVSFSLSRLSDKLPGVRKEKKKSKEKHAKRGAPSRFDEIVEDALVEMLQGRSETLDVSTSWSGEKRGEAYATALFVVTQLTGNN